MIYILVNTCFLICPSWSMFHQELIPLREIFQKNGYPDNFIDRYFKQFLNRIHILKEKVPTGERKPVRSVLPYLKTICLQTRIKLQKSIKRVLNCYKLKVNFKSQSKLCNNFRFKDPVTQILISSNVDHAMNTSTENA